MLRDLFAELRRRHVYRVGAAYATAGWLLIELTTQVFPVLDMPAWTQKLVVLLIVFGFPVALILAWAFEVTPEGVRRTEAADAMTARSAEERRRAGRVLDVVIIVILVLALGIALWRPWAGKTAASRPLASTVATATATAPAAPASVDAADHSIAVLPFANLSGDKSQQYFSDGISEDLLNLLARIPQLQVTARTSSFWFRGKDYTIPQIAQKLRVAYILEGSVQKAGDEVRISVQLVDAATDTQRWSQTYDRQLKDVFKIQDEIGADVVKQLKIRLLGEAPKVRKVDPHAYTLFLKALEFRHQNDPQGYARSDALLHQVLAIDPQYALAWIMLAYNAMGENFVSMKPDQGVNSENADRISTYAGKARAIAPDSAGVESLYGVIASGLGHYQEAARHYKRSLQLAPANAGVMENIGLFLYRIDRQHASIAWIKAAQRLDPVNGGINWSLFSPLIALGRYDAAIASQRRLLQQIPDMAGAHASIAWALLAKGEPKAALAEYRLEPNRNYRLTIKASLYCKLGRKADARRVIDYLKAHYASTMQATIASAYADCGDADQAFKWLDIAARSTGNPGLIYVVYGLSFQPYHQDPRWKAFLRKAGYAPDQLAKIKFDVKLPDVSP